MTQPDPSDLETLRGIELEHAERLLKGVIIPPKPSVLVQVLDERHKDEPDLDRISEIISGDVALTAGTLKVVNSAFFGLPRRVGSIQHAVRLVGLSNITNIVTGLMLHSAFGDGGGAFMSAFWEHSQQLARVATVVASHVPGVAADDAYTTGLLADCGVPLLARRFPEYPEVFREALSASDAVMTAVEHARVGTDHCLVGYIVARSWKLPDPVCQCIMRHHDLEPYFDTPEYAGKLPLSQLGVLMLAIEMQRGYNGMPTSVEWQQHGEGVLAHLALDPGDLDAVRESVESALNAPYESA